MSESPPTNEVSLAVPNESEEPAIYLNQPIFDQPDIEGTEQDSVTVQDDDVENGPAPAKRVFTKRKLGDNLPSSIPVVYRTNMEYDAATNTLKRKPDSREHEAGLQLYSQAARLLKSITKPLAVVSVCGRYRSGKSYFLSRMLGSSDAFSLGHTMHACTFGIWMGTTILECDEYAILLLDTEGIDAVGSTGTSDASILVMTILLSSFMIYNSVHAPTRTDLEKMSCFTVLSQSISIRAGEENEDMTDFRVHFPDFLWLLRDVTLEPTDKESDKSITPAEFLMTQVLVPGNTIRLTVADEVVMCIRNYFPTIDCKTLPIPSADKGVMQNISEREDELSPDFIKSMQEVVESVKLAAKVKKGFNGITEVNGSTLVELTKQYLVAVNTPNAVPTLDTSWQKVLDARMTDLCGRLLQEYSNDMKKALKGKYPVEVGKKGDGCLNENTLMGIHERIMEMKLAQLESELQPLVPVNTNEKFSARQFSSRNAEMIERFKIQVETYEEVEIGGVKVERVADGLFFKFIQRNYNESFTFCAKLFQELLEPIDEKIKEALAAGKQAMYTYPQLQEDADEMYKTYQKKAVGPAKDLVFKERKETILDRQMQMYQTMIGFKSELLDAKQQAFEANEQATEAQRRVTELERTIKGLELKLLMKEKELKVTKQDQIISHVKRQLSKQMKEEKQKFDSLSKSKNAHDLKAAEASKQKMEKLKAESEKLLEEMKAEQERKIQETQNEIETLIKEIHRLAEKRGEDFTEDTTADRDYNVDADYIIVDKEKEDPTSDDGEKHDDEKPSEQQEQPTSRRTCIIL